MRVVLVGPPGAGKGTQAQFIADHLSIPKISTGDLFRAHVSQGTGLGREAKRYMESGELVPDEVTVGMVRERLLQPDASDGFLLDGFPRNVPQARTLDVMLRGLPGDGGLDVVLELVVDKDEVIRRLSGRRTCATCNHVWHVEFDPPKVEGVCDLCGGVLFQRDDDRAETIITRLAVYDGQTAPLITYYAEHGVLIGIDASGTVEDVTDRALAAVRSHEHAADRLHGH